MEHLDLLCSLLQNVFPGSFLVMRFLTFRTVTEGSSRTVCRVQDSTCVSFFQHFTSFSSTSSSLPPPSQAVLCCFVGAEPPGASSRHTSLPKISQMGHEVSQKGHWSAVSFPISRKLVAGRWAATVGTQLRQNFDASSCSV